MESTVIFLHIPKAAGTTLKTVIRRQYPSNAIYSTEDDLHGRIAELKALPEEVRGRFRMVMGHLPFGIDALVPGPATYFTVLRDPVERVLSTYYFILRQPNHPMHGAALAREAGLPAVLRSGAIPMLDNGQMRALSGLNHLEEIPYGACTRELLDRVKHNIETRIAVAGITERFDETLLLLKHTFGWKRVFYENRNVTAQRPGKSTLNEETLQLIREYNRFDLELYDWVRKRLEARIAELGRSFHYEVALFKRMNRLLNGTRTTYGRVRRGWDRRAGRVVIAKRGARG